MIYIHESYVTYHLSYHNIQSIIHCIFIFIFIHSIIIYLFVCADVKEVVMPTPVKAMLASYLVDKVCSVIDLFIYLHIYIVLIHI